MTHLIEKLNSRLQNFWKSFHFSRACPQLLCAAKNQFQRHHQLLFVAWGAQQSCQALNWHNLTLSCSSLNTSPRQAGLFHLLFLTLPFLSHVSQAGILPIPCSNWILFQLPQNWPVFLLWHPTWVVGMKVLLSCVWPPVQSCISGVSTIWIPPNLTFSLSYCPWFSLPQSVSYLPSCYCSQFPLLNKTCGEILYYLLLSTEYKTTGTF